MPLTDWLAFNTQSCWIYTQVNKKEVRYKTACVSIAIFELFVVPVKESDQNQSQIRDQRSP